MSERKVQDQSILGSLFILELADGREVSSFQERKE